MVKIARPISESNFRASVTEMRTKRSVIEELPNQYWRWSRWCFHKQHNRRETNLRFVTITPEVRRGSHWNIVLLFLQVYVEYHTRHFPGCKRCHSYLVRYLSNVPRRKESTLSNYSILLQKITSIMGIDWRLEKVQCKGEIYRTSVYDIRHWMYLVNEYILFSLCWLY